VTQLTTHFTLEEFQKGDPIPDACIGIFTELAEKILEPVRAEFNQAIVITSGYRSEKENEAAHGQPNSEHMATTYSCACDFYSERIGQRFVFDWMRLNPSLPFHQLIFEHGANNSSIVHVSINKMMPGVRSVLEGSEHNASPYVKIDHVAYVPPQQAGIAT
jgi:hypothetical protein